MTLSAVAVDGAITASHHNQVRDHVNTARGYAVFTANGTWSVPSGVHNFVVYLSGGGGAAGSTVATGGELDIYYPGGKGGDGGLCSKVISGQDIGTSFAITIGAAGVASTFGALLSSNPGGNGGSYPTASQGIRGTHNGTLGHGNAMFVDADGVPYGSGGIPVDAALPTGIPPKQGICVITW